MVDIVERCWLDLKRMGLTEEMDTVATVSMIEKLLPSVQKREWIISLDASSTNYKGMFERLLNYLLREKRVIEYTEHELRTNKTRTVHQATLNYQDQPSTSYANGNTLQQASGSIAPFILLCCCCYTTCTYATHCCISIRVLLATV